MSARNLLQRSDTFSRRFSLEAQRGDESTDDKAKHVKKPIQKGFRLYTWWLTLLIAAALPAWAAHMSDLSSAWRKIDSAIRDTLEFPRTHNIHIPCVKGRAEGRRYEQTNTDLIKWHIDLAKLTNTVQDETPIGTTADSTLEFQFGEPLPQSPVRESRAWAVTLYFVLAASLYFVDSIHMAVILLQFNILELGLALKIKQLDDALEKTLDHLGGKQMELAMLPMETSVDDVGQQLICLQKMNIFHTAWEKVNLGQNMRVPFRHDYINLNLQLVFSVIAAVMLRCLEVVLLSIWPNIPRFALMHRIAGWLRDLPGSRLTKAASEDTRLQSVPSQPESFGPPTAQRARGECKWSMQKGKEGSSLVLSPVPSTKDMEESGEREALAIGNRERSGSKVGGSYACERQTEVKCGDGMGE